MSQLTVRSYRLHVYKHPSGYVLTKSTVDSRGGAMPTVEYQAWESLRRVLKACGVTESALSEAANALHKDADCQIADIALTDEQVRLLGFTS